MYNLVSVADGVNHICANTHEILSLVGWALTIFKIAIPMIIIALGLIDLGKAAVSSKPEEIKKCATSLIYRLVGGAVIFFLPTIVMLVFGLVNNFNDAKDEMDFDICYKCITVPWNDTCKNAVSCIDNPDHSSCQ